jgi:hypothetical protein
MHLITVVVENGTIFFNLQIIIQTYKIIFGFKICQQATKFKFLEGTYFES